MKNDYLISVPKAGFVESWYWHVVGELGDAWIVSLRTSEDPMPNFPTGTLIGSWELDGTLIGTVDPIYSQIRPLGNNDDGTATGPLEYPKGFGWSQRMLTDTSLYAADNQPFEVTIERVWDDDVTWPGWGWTATIEFVDPNRDPSVRAVLVDMVDNVGSGEYTTGAFILVEVGEDENGDPIMKYQTGHQTSRVSDEPQEITVTLLYASQPEGKWTLKADETKVTKLFWEAGQTQPGESWQDSGATVSSMAGTVTLVSDVTPFSVGLLCRIDGVEQTVQSIWAGQGLILDPYTVNPTGAMIEVFV